MSKKVLIFVAAVLSSYLSLGCEGEDLCELDPALCEGAEIDPEVMAEPCALDENADQNPESDVSQVKLTISPDFGDVPDGGIFEGDPTEMGQYSVVVQETNIAIFARTVEAAGRTIEIEPGVLKGTAYLPEGVTEKMPLIVVMAGFQAGHASYAAYSEHFASYGFAVLGVDTRSENLSPSHAKEAVEVMSVLDWVDTNSVSPFLGLVDMTKIAIAGHSKGGKVAFYASAIDYRIDLVIAWDPSNSGGPPCGIAGIIPGQECNAIPIAPNCALGSSGTGHFMNAESLVLGVPRDLLLNPDAHLNSIHFYRGAPSPAMFVQLKGGHASSVPGPVLGINLGVAEIIRINKGVQLAFVLSRFAGMTGDDLDAWLPDTAAGVENILAQDKEKVIRVDSK
jgi:hypothetical protein